MKASQAFAELGGYNEPLGLISRHLARNLAGCIKSMERPVGHCPSLLQGKQNLEASLGSNLPLQVRVSSPRNPEATHQ